MIRSTPSAEDLIGIEHCKLGFYQELRQKLMELQLANLVSERQRLETAAILDGITDLMMVLSEDLCIISVNHVFHDILGVENPEGQYCFRIFRGEDHPCPECPAHRSFLTGAVCRETAIFRIDGRNLHFEMVASPIWDPSNNERRILIFKRDVTREKEYQAKFYLAEKMATVGMLAAGVAHEVNNPLAAISGFAQGLQRCLGRMSLPEGTELDDVNDYITTILKECTRCQDIVCNLLTFSRPVSSSSCPLQLNTIVHDTVKLLRPHIEGKGLKLRIRSRLALDLPLVLGDEPQLKQVLLNLLVNAVDAVEQGGLDQGSIVVTTAVQDGKFVTLAVTDTGCGIPKEHRDKLFEPFFTTKPVGKGVGIGLSTCYGIVKEHGGEIVVSSELNTGSTFLVRLPVAAISHGA